MDIALPLRDYQETLVRQVWNNWLNGDKRVLVQSATGSGKSLIIAELVNRVYRQGGKVLIIAHRIELIRQLIEHLDRWLCHRPGVIANRRLFPPDPDNPIQVASIQTLARREIGNYHLVVIDEAHHSSARTYSRIFSRLKNSYFLGCTATPCRMDGRGLDTLYDRVEGFQSLLTGVSTSALIDRGYLTPVEVYAPKAHQVSAEGRVSIVAGQYNAKQLASLVGEELSPEAIVQVYKQYCNGSQTVLFPVSVAASIEYVEALSLSGISAAHIDAKTSATERQEIIQSFSMGEISVLSQHSILVEGFDVPAIEAVIFARPTRSLVIWFQGIGRAMRPSQGKQKAKIIDLTDNHERLPLPIDHVDWGLKATSLPDASFSFTCSSCDHVYRLTDHEKERGYSYCPACGEKLDLGNPDGLSSEELYDLYFGSATDYDFYVADLLGYREAHNYKPGWVWFKLFDAIKAKECKPPTRSELRYLARILGYQSSWAKYKASELKDKFPFLYPESGEESKETRSSASQTVFTLRL